MTTYTCNCCFTIKTILSKLFCCGFKYPQNHKDHKEHEEYEGIKNISLLTYNTQILIGHLSNHKLDHLIESLISISHKVDILLLQEVFVESGRDRLINELKQYWHYYIGKANKDRYIVEDSGLMIFSKYPIESHVFYPFNSMIGIDQLANRGFLLVGIRINNKLLKIINTHLQSDWGMKEKNKNTKRQDIRVSQLLQISEIKSDIIAGDFNIDHKTLEYRNIFSFLKKKDIYPDNIDRPETYIDGSLLDYIFVKKKIKVNARQVYKFEKNNLIPSDHYAVYAKLKI